MQHWRMEVYYSIIIIIFIIIGKFKKTIFYVIFIYVILCYLWLHMILDWILDKVIKNK